VNNRLKHRLRAKEIALGSWITLDSAAIAEIMAAAGFDWVVVDLEHSVIDLSGAASLIRTIDLCGAAPLVRLTSNDQDQIKRVMDAGAHGIVVPMVNSAEEAAHAVAATRYAVAGSRGVGLARAQGYGATYPDYLHWQVDGPVVIVQIEHRDAITRLEEILTVRGVDGFLIGPYDLSCSMGIPGEFERSEFVDAIAHIREVGQRLGVPAGLHIVEPDLQRLEQVIHEGYTFIAYSVDTRMLDVCVRQALTKMKDLLRSGGVGTNPTQPDASRKPMNSPAPDLMR
jgi:2-keto-3-deoxy-L-rhamnonate aldolase RhmA